VYLSNRHSKKLAIQSGAFDKPEIRLSFMGYDLTTTTKVPFTWCLVHPGSAGEKAIYPFSFYISNFGTASCENAVLVIQASRFVIPEEKDLPSKQIIVPGVYKDSTKKSIVNLDGFNQASYLLPPIHPKTSFMLSDNFIFEPSRVIMPINAETIDRAKVSMKSTVHWSYPFTITVLLKNQSAIVASFRIECISAKTLEEGISQYLVSFQKLVTNYLSSLKLWIRLN